MEAYVQNFEDFPVSRRSSEPGFWGAVFEQNVSACQPKGLAKIFGEDDSFGR
jgi:hypothetical protein